jgi:hypothetical protein
MNKLMIVIAACVCTVSVHAQVSVLQKMVNAVSADSLMSYDRTLERASGTYSRVCYTPGNDSAVQYILRSLKKNQGMSFAGLDTFYVDTAKAPYNKQPLANVFATILGKKDTSKLIVIGAHLDSYAGRESTWQAHWQTTRAPGADDNGTGVAALLEMGRIFGNGAAYGFAPDYTIMLVAFNAEEAGVVYDHWLYGAVHFVNRIKAAGYSVEAMIAFDMVGYNTNLATDVVANSASEFIGKRSVQMNEMFGLGLAMNAPPFVYAVYSDHATFWDAGYPAILLVEHAPPNVDAPNYKANKLYHSSADTSGSINPELFKRSSQMALATVASLALPQLLTSVNAAPSVVPAAAALGQNFPNPFNPATRIPYTVASAQHVRIIVYDILGREAATLVDRAMEPGSYGVDWNAAAVKSGVYFCRMTVGAVTDVKKIVVIK